MLVSGNNITASVSVTYGGFGILTGTKGIQAAITMVYGIM